MKLKRKYHICNNKHFMQLLSVLLSLVLVATATGCEAQEDEKDPFRNYGRLVWAEEFDGTELNQKDWSYDTGAGIWGNGELQTYTDRNDNLSVKDGIAEFKAVLNDDGWTSSRIQTQGKHAFQYGLFEARMKLSTDSGYLPAFWLLTEDELYGEIDIMEHIADEPYVYGTAHWAPEDPDGIKSSGSDGENTEIFPNDFSVTDWHVYAVDWQEDAITWYVDDIEYYRLDFSTLSNDAGQAFQQNMYLILNLAVGGDWPGKPNDSDKSETMQVDFVRVYAKRN